MCNTKLLLAAWDTWTVKNQGLRGFQHPSPRSRCRLLWGPRVCHWEPSQRWWSNFPRRRACDHGKGRQMPEAMARATGETATLCGECGPRECLEQACGGCWASELHEKWRTGTQDAFLPPLGCSVPMAPSIDKACHCANWWRRNVCRVHPAPPSQSCGRKGQCGAKTQYIHNWQRLWLQNSIAKKLRTYLKVCIRFR